MSAMPNLQTIRQEILLEHLVLVDGQPGCGKTLFTALIAAMERVELLNFSFELENLCALKYLNKISQDAVEAMIRIQMDLVLYETMMGRRANVRPRDLSSVFRDVDWFEYLKRILGKGDQLIPDRILREQPILHFATHNLLSFSRPIFDALAEKVVIVEVVRHPLYMLIQQTINQRNFYTAAKSARQPHLYIGYKGSQVPFWNYGLEQSYLEGNPVERAIYEMKNISLKAAEAKVGVLAPFSERILTIPFERFVLQPKEYLVAIADLLGSRLTKRTLGVMKKQNIPRKKISDGIPLEIYKRCGWQPPVQGLGEKDELMRRRDFAVKEGASEAAMEMLDELSAAYEAQYMNGIFSPDPR